MWSRSWFVEPFSGFECLVSLFSGRTMTSQISLYCSSCSLGWLAVIHSDVIKMAIVVSARRAIFFVFDGPRRNGVFKVALRRIRLETC